jgi:pimeloyl-ACP methyl ester carboxylesterase
VEGIPAGLKFEDGSGAAALQQARILLLGFQDNRAKATDQFVRSLFKTRQPEMLFKELAEGSLKTPIGAAASIYLDLLTGDRRPALARVEVPSLILTDEMNRSAGEYLRSRISRSTLEVIEGAGAAIFLDKPQAFNQILEVFLGEH